MHGTRAARCRSAASQTGRLAADVEGAAALRRRAADSVRRRHERGFPRWLCASLPISNWPDKRASAAICYLDAGARARQSHHHQRRDGHRHCCSTAAAPPASPRRSAARREAVHRPRDHRQPRRHPFAGHADALRHRSRRRICASTASRCAPICPASARTCPTIRCCSSAFTAARGAAVAVAAAASA